MKPKTTAQGSWTPFLWIIAACALAHGCCLGAQFYMDDAIGILDSEIVREGGFWQNPPLAWTYLGHVIQYRLFGMSAVAFHTVNNLHFPALRSGHRLFQRPSPGKQFSCSIDVIVKNRNIKRYLFLSVIINPDAIL
ncbi:MAG: hypothetical protein NTV46_00545 [Verrucomicrobia bacterium]|nr:hypothetical protein [Verrucomicrobiota bacterium]